MVFLVFYLYGLTDYIPGAFHSTILQHSFPIRRNDVVQSYQVKSFFEIGVTYKKTDNGKVRTYDLERLLIELFRLKEKYPREICYEVINSLRKIRDQIDFCKLNKYLKHFKREDSIMIKIKEMI